MCYSNARSQWVNITDANFANYLSSNFPACMNGNQMDTTCINIRHATVIYCDNRNINSLEGVQYFDSLRFLRCQSNELVTLPSLPTKLTFLDCSNNQLTSLPILPNSLGSLVCQSNQLTVLPALPQSLGGLNCRLNQLTSLPNLPSALTDLNCGFNSISVLPSLPDSLKNLNCDSDTTIILPSLPLSLLKLECSGCLLDSLPALPASLITLSSNNNNLTSLPTLPNGLESLGCRYNNLISLPVLPNSLKYIYCSYNQLGSLPALPTSLNDLQCDNNLLTTLPALPDTLSGLYCNHNQLNSLPPLPTNLRELHCGYNSIDSLPPLSSLRGLRCNNNQLSSLPSLPATLTSLYCDSNQLITLPLFPDGMMLLDCSDNLLTSLPEFPDSMGTVDIYNNPNLKCLPKLKRFGTLNFFNTGIQCIPNYKLTINANPPLSSFPLCDFYNPDSCTSYSYISGKIYSDQNINCINDSNESRLKSIKVELYHNNLLIQQQYTNIDGFYSFDTDTGTFICTTDSAALPFFAVCPSSGFHTSVLTLIDSMDSDNDFSMQCKPGFDIGVNSIMIFGSLIPGDNSTVKISAGDLYVFYGMNCTSGLSGTITVDINGPGIFISASPGSLIPSVSGNTLTYSINDFSTVDFFSDFTFFIRTDSNALANDQVCFDVAVTPVSGDNNTFNNTLNQCSTVRNSFDPNAKEVIPDGDIFATQEWLTYTIYFQNTGNAPAHRVYILDTLDQHIDPSSFTLLAYSHNLNTHIDGNVVRFSFPGINLPDSISDEPNSHGYIQYKVKLLPGIPILTNIYNKAYIYFDFNSPVITNTVTNFIIDNVSVSEEISPIKFNVYPNPINTNTRIAFNLNNSSELKIDLFDIVGKCVLTIAENKFASGFNEINFATENLGKGIYFLRFTLNGSAQTVKICK